MAKKAGSEEDEQDNAGLLVSLGEEVRTRRHQAGLSLRALGERSGVSERFLVLVEGGKANISVVRLEAIGRALGTNAAGLLQGFGATLPASADIKKPRIALLGLRGAGKTTIGSRAAARLGLPFVELDDLVCKRAGMSLAEIFEMQGQAYFRKLEREELDRLIDAQSTGIVATSGSLVMDHEAYEKLRREAITVWLRARPEDHFQRVLDQGDARPMESRPAAMQELRGILRARRPLYERARHVIDTSALGLDRSIDRLVKIVNEASRGTLPGPAA